MKSFVPRTIAIALAGALAITSFPLAPAQAAPVKAVQASSDTAVTTTDLSAQRRRGYNRGYRGHRGGNGAALGAFAAIVGTIGVLAATQRHRRYEERYYGHPYRHGYGYGGYGYGGYRGAYRY